jgi:hypothetical protein
MASLTFYQAKVLFAPLISSLGPTDPNVAAGINFVNERFINSGQWKGNRFIYSFPVSVDSDGNYYFDTVEGIESVMKVIAVDSTSQTGEQGSIMADWFPWDESGLGWLPNTYVGDLQLIRQGLTPSYPSPYGAGDDLTFTAPTQRYRVIGANPETRTMYCLVRRGYVALKNDADILMPSSTNAYRYGLQAYIFESANELERAKVYWDLAFQCLNEITSNFEEGEQAQIQIQTKAFAPSLLKNLI